MHSRMANFINNMSSCNNFTINLQYVIYYGHYSSIKRKPIEYQVSTIVNFFRKLLSHVNK